MTILDQGIRDASVRSDLIADICGMLNHLRAKGWDDIYVNINPTDGIQYSITRISDGKKYTEEYDSRNEQPLEQINDSD